MTEREDHSWGFVLRHRGAMVAIIARTKSLGEGLKDPTFTLSAEHGPLSPEALRGLRDLIDEALKEVKEPKVPNESRTRFDREPLL